MCDDVRVTVIIPTYNMGKYVGSAISTVLDGSFTDLEVLVIDDGSTDDTEAIVSRFVDSSSDSFDPRVRYVHQENRGKPVAVNHGFDRAQGEYVAILDADDELPPRGIEKRYEVATASSPPADCIIGAFTIIDEEGKAVGRRPTPETTAPKHLRRKYFLSYRTPFHLNACLIHRRLISRVGGVDTQLTRCEDIDYAIRLLNATRKLKTVEAPVYRYRKYRESLRERLRMRWITMRKRQIVLARHVPSLLKPAAVAVGIVVDSSKLLYESIFGNYQS